MLLALLLACALHTRPVGLVERDGRRLLLARADAPALRLSLTEGARPVDHLDGCTVELEGTRIGRRLVVRDWRVLDAGDGSAPYVGRLERRGLRWFLEDRDSGMDVLLAGPAAEAGSGLTAHAGELVMVVGFVEGPQQVRVVAWRPLEGEEPAGAGGGS